MNKVYIALGSNISPRMSYLQQAIDLLKEHDDITLTNCSAIYETEPVGYTEQDKFLNMVVEIETPLAAISLLTICQTFERTLGRKREIKWGPRTIDLDILLYNQENMETKELSIPHPRLHERAFVLIPLADINSTLLLPNIETTVAEALLALSSSEKEGVVEWAKGDVK